MGIITRYLVKELILPFVLSVAVLFFLLATQQAVQLIDLLVNRGVDVSVLLKIFIALLPAFLVITLPIAGLTGTIGAFTRLANDREILALQSSGVRSLRLVGPAAMFAAILCLTVYFLSIIGEPWAGQSFRSLTADLLKRQATVALTDGSFYDAFEGITLYVESIPSGNQLDGVLLVDQRNPAMPAVVLAEQGAFVGGSDGAPLGLRLSQGNIYRGLQGIGIGRDRYQTVRFETYELRLDDARLNASMGLANQRPELAALRARAAGEIRANGRINATTRRGLVIAYKDLAFPFATFWLGIAGVPLGITARRAGRIGGFALGLLVVGGYYMLLIASDTVGLWEWVPPLSAAWLPNAVLIAVTGWLLLRLDRVR